MSAMNMSPSKFTAAPDGAPPLFMMIVDCPLARSTATMSPVDESTTFIPPLPSTGRKTAANARARTTLCISSQVGCRQGCAFCATGRMGLLRDLSTDEILVQAWWAKRAAAKAGLPPLANVVFMGMGEPADNTANVRAAVDCLVDPARFGFSRQFYARLQFRLPRREKIRQVVVIQWLLAHFRILPVSGLSAPCVLQGPMPAVCSQPHLQRWAREE